MAESNLPTLLKIMKPELNAGAFVFCSLPKDAVVPSDAVMVFQESEGLTVIVPEQNAPTGVPTSHPRAWIVLTVHSDLASVGFLAQITNTLAAEGISCNAVSAYYHDQLFVPVEKAMDVLRRLSGKNWNYGNKRCRFLFPMATIGVGPVGTMRTLGYSSDWSIAW